MHIPTPPNFFFRLVSVLARYTESQVAIIQIHIKPAWINHQSPPHFFIPKIESFVVLPIIKFCTISKISKTTQIDYLSVCPCPLSCLRILFTFFSSCRSYFTGNTIPLHGSDSSFFFSLYLWLTLLFLLTA